MGASYVSLLVDKVGKKNLLFIGITLILLGLVGMNIIRIDYTIGIFSLAAGIIVSYYTCKDSIANLSKLVNPPKSLVKEEKKEVQKAS